MPFLRIPQVTSSKVVPTECIGSSHPRTAFTACAAFWHSDVRHSRTVPEQDDAHIVVDIRHRQPLQPAEPQYRQSPATIHQGPWQHRHLAKSVMPRLTRAPDRPGAQLRSESGQALLAHLPEPKAKAMAQRNAAVTTSGCFALTAILCAAVRLSARATKPSQWCDAGCLTGTGAPGTGPTPRHRGPPAMCRDGRALHSSMSPAASDTCSSVRRRRRFGLDNEGVDGLGI